MLRQEKENSNRVHRIKRNKVINKPWWDDLCQQAINKRNKWFKIFFANLSRENIMKYRAASIKTRKTLAKRIRENFSNLVEKVAKVLGSQKFREKIKIHKNCKVFKQSMLSNISRDFVIEKFINEMVAFMMYEEMNVPKDSSRGRGSAKLA